MGIPVMIMGDSGSGKSTSLRNFNPNEIGIFNVANKPLPFRKKFEKICNGANYKLIKDVLRKHKLNTYVIDDSQYLMAFALFDRAKETGYSKFTDTALDFRDLIQTVITQTPDDVIVYFLHHTETTDTGKVKAKTSGKMLDNQLTVEGLFSIVLLAKTDGTNYVFETHSDGFTTAKSPMDMFNSREIPNDLKEVDRTIREYWNLENQKDEKGERNETNS